MDIGKLNKHKNKMRKTNDFLFGCALSIIYTIWFSIYFAYHYILFIPFAFIAIICAIAIGLFCLPIAIVVLLFYVLMMIVRFIVDVFEEKF